MSTDWQTTRSNIKERGKYMYKNELYSDVEFSVVNSKGDTVIVPAHKYTLAIGSPVFGAMFYGGLAETSRTISLPDCTAEGLLELFRFLYYDEVKLTVENILDVIYIANKYIVPPLIEKCGNYIQKEMEAGNVFSILPEIKKLEDKKLETICWNAVDTKTQRAVTSVLFLSVTQEMLCDILKRDSLEITELELFLAVERWAENKIQEQELDEGGQIKRAVLGDKLIHLIRFPLMTMDEFVEIVLPTRILSTDEFSEMISFYHWNGVKSLLKIFNAKRRVGLPRIEDSCKKFDAVHPEDCRSGTDHSITFTTDRLIYITGIRLKGWNGNKGTVKLSIYKDHQILLDQDQEYCINEQKQADVVQIRPLCVPPGTEYTIQISIDGEAFLYKTTGKTSIECKYVTFHFNGCSSKVGNKVIHWAAFPELLFYQYCKTTLGQ